MNCKEAKRYINVFIDSELDAKTNLEISEHLSSCDNCKRRFAQEERIEKSLVSALKEDKAPKSLEIWERVISSLPAEEDDSPSLETAHRPERHLGFLSFLLKNAWGRQANVRYIAPTTVVIIAIITTLFLYNRQGPNELILAAQKCHSEYIANEIIPSIESTSPNEVIDYFSGKFTFSVTFSEILGLKSHHVSLHGAKVCHLKGVSTAYIMYHCCNTPISVFVLSTKDTEHFFENKQHLKGDEILFEIKDGVKFVAIPTNLDTYVCVIANHDLDLLRHVAKNFVRT